MRSPYFVVVSWIYVCHFLKLYNGMAGFIEL